MMGRTHQLIGATTAYSITAIADTRPIPTVITVAVGWFASPLPDKDFLIRRGQLWVRRYQITLGVLLLAAAGFLATLFPPVLLAIPVALGVRAFPLVEHRGVTHYLVTLIVFAALVLFIAAMVAWALAGNITAGFAAGYGMHIFADGCTISGVKMLAPFYDKPIHLLPEGMRIRTDGNVEHRGLVPAIIVGCWALLATRYGTAIATGIWITVGVSLLIQKRPLSHWAQLPLKGR